jgi:hypothetical protein
MKKIVSLVLGVLVVGSVVYAAQVAVTSNETLNEAWTIETNNNSDLQTNINAKADDSTVVHDTGNQSIDGVKTFTSSPLVPSPVSGTSAINRDYLESTTDIVIDYFLNNTVSDLGGIYYEMTNVGLGGVESTITTAGLAASTNDQTLNNYVTLSGEPGILAIPSGIFDVHIHAERTGGNSSINLYALIYKRATGGTETLITTTETSGLITSKTEVVMHANTVSDTDLLATDRIVVKLFANIGSGSGATVAIYQEGTTVSRLVIPTTTDILSNIFVRVDATNLPADTNYVTDAEKVVIGNTSNTNTGDENTSPVDAADENAAFYFIIVDGATGLQVTETDIGITYNPSTNVLTVLGGIETGPSTDPFTSLNDSDSPGTDKWIGSWEGDYTDGGDGSENADLFWYGQQGGSKTLLWTFDESDDQLEFEKEIDVGSNPINTTGVIKGRMEIGPNITGATAHDTIELHNTFNPFTAAATVTLDAAADAGYGSVSTYWIRDAAEAAVIDLDGAEKINLDGVAGGAGVAITATGVGSSITLIAVTDTDGSGTDGYIALGNNGFVSE